MSEKLTLAAGAGTTPTGVGRASRRSDEHGLALHLADAPRRFAGMARALGLAAMLACTEESGTETAADTSIPAFPDIVFPEADVPEGGDALSSDVPDPSDAPPNTSEVTPNDPDSVAPHGCAPNPCTDPGSRCDGDLLRTWDGPGECTIGEDRLMFTCTYPEPEVRDCAAEGQRCLEEKGICVPCLEDADCGVLEVCDVTVFLCRPACALDAYEENDTQDAAAAIAAPAVLTDLNVCGLDPDWYAVSLTEPSALRVTLTSEIISDDLTVRVVAADGTAVEPSPDTPLTVHTPTLPTGTHFIEVRGALPGVSLPYAMALELGAGPSCVPNPCVAPGTSGCEGNSVVAYTTDGVCTEVEGQPSCSYTAEAQVDCGAGHCLAGGCSPYRLPVPGELVLSELMVKPGGSVATAPGQWLEITNAGTATVTLQTLEIRIDGATAPPLGAHYLAPGDTAVVGRSPNTELNGGVLVDLVTPLPLWSALATVELFAGDTMLDDVDVDDSFPAAPGASLALLPAHFTPDANDAGSAWCRSRTPYGLGGAGTPGAVNGPCTYTIADCRAVIRKAGGTHAPLDDGAVLQAGDPITAAARVHIPGLTDLTDAFDSTHPLIATEFGFGLSASPDDNWAWEPASADTLLLEPLVDQWTADLGVTPAGKWHMAFRVTGDASESWVLCDADGSAFDGGVPLEVRTNACKPGACPVPQTECDGDVLRFYDEGSVTCQSELGVAKCQSSPSVSVDCAATGKLCDAAELACVGCEGDDECTPPFEACVDGSCVPRCTDDAREDDDSPDTAASVGLGALTGVVCAGDPDHLGLPVLAGDRLTLTVTPTAGGPLLVELLDPSGGTQLYAGVSADGSTYLVDAPSGTSGLWVLRVSVPSGGNATYAVSTAASPNGCLAAPCAATQSSCANESTLEIRDLAGCTPGEGLARECEYAATPLTYACGVLCIDGACQNTRPPAAGELVLTEVQRDGEQWWIELVVKASNLAATGVELRGGATVYGRFDLPQLAPGTRVVVTSAPGIPASIVLLASATSPLPEAAAVTLAHGAVTIDTATWAMGLSQAVGVHTSHSQPTDNDLAAAFCPQVSIYLGASYGTPGAENDACPLTGLWCRFQHPEASEEAPSASFEAFVRVFAGSVTELTAGVDTDPYQRLRVQTGYGPPEAPPATWASWVDAKPNPSWDAQNAIPFPEPPNDEYSATLSAPGTPGSFHVAGRLSGDRGLTWLYCDLGSSNPSQDGAANGYSPTTAATLVVTNPCPPNSCLTPPPPRCEGADRVVPVAPGFCSMSAGTLHCDYTEQRSTCTFGCINAACVLAAAAQPGDVVLTEVSVADGKVEWVEIWNPTGAAVAIGGYALNGAVLPASAYLLAGARRVIGFTTPGDITLPAVIPASAALTLSSDGGVEVAAIPIPTSGGLSLSEEPEGSPFGVRHCALPASPGLANGLCPVTIGWCRLQHPTSVLVDGGSSSTIYGRVWSDGLTGLTAGVDDYPGLLAEAGYGPAGTAPDASWSWTAAEPNPAWNGGTAIPTPEPNNDEYQTELVWPVSPGSYSFAFRFSGDGGETWLTCDTGVGAADGFSPSDAGDATVVLP